MDAGDGIHGFFAIVRKNRGKKAARRSGSAHESSRGSRKGFDEHDVFRIFGRKDFFVRMRLQQNPRNEIRLRACRRRRGGFRASRGGRQGAVGLLPVDKGHARNRFFERLGRLETRGRDSRNSRKSASVGWRRKMCARLDGRAHFAKNQTRKGRKNRIFPQG